MIFSAGSTACMRVFALAWLCVSWPALAGDSDALFNEAYARYQQAIAMGRPPRETLADARTAYTLGRAMYGESHTNTAGLAMNYGNALVDANHNAGAGREALVEARAVLHEALAIYERNFGADSVRLIDPLMALGAAVATQDERSGQTATNAAHFFDRAIKLAPAEDGALKAGLYVEAGGNLLQWARSPDAREYFQHAVDLYDALGPAHAADAATGHVWLGKLALGQARYSEAAKEFNKALATFAADPDQRALELVTRGHLVDAYDHLGRTDDATAQAQAIGKAQAWNADVEPEPLVRWEPKYPAIANLEGGWAKIRFTIDAEGRVRDAAVVEHSGAPAFAKATLEAIQKWRYAPRYVDGVPVATPNNTFTWRFFPDRSNPKIGSHIY